MPQLSPKEIAAIVKEAMRQNASEGGHERARKLTKKRRSEIAQQAANARWSKVKPQGT